MTSGTRNDRSTLVAELEAGEQTARLVCDLAERFAAEDVAVSIADAGNGRWRVAIHFRTAPDQDAVRAAVAAAAGAAAAATLRFARLEEADWVGQSLAGLAPVAAGRFIVHGAHDRARIPINRIGIEIEAGLAFGTGHHGTTRGCLLALDRICKAMSKARRAKVHRHSEARANGSGPKWPARRQAPRASKGGGPGRYPSRRAFGAHLRMTRPCILDLGTGSGVLAIAAARALRARVLARDIDADAVAVARANARLNRVGPMVEVVQAAGVTPQNLRARAPFDLIFANILLASLLRIAAPLRRLTARGGHLVLSGLLPAQANAAIAAYRPLALERRIELAGWTTLVFVRRM